MSLRTELCLSLTVAICGCFISADSAVAADATSQLRPAIVAQAAVPANTSDADSGVTRSSLSNASGEQAIKQALSGRTNLEFIDVPLKAAMEYVSEKHRIPIHFDVAALKEAGLDPSKNQVSIALKDISLRSALDLILSQFGLTPIIKDEVLLITTRDRAGTMLETHLYDVRDLVARDNDRTGGTDTEGLADAIRQTVNPSSWDKAGGLGSLAPFNNNGVSAFIVVQTYDSHDQIENLLSELRKLKPQRAIRQ